MPWSLSWLVAVLFVGSFVWRERWLLFSRVKAKQKKNLAGELARLRSTSSA